MAGNRKRGSSGNGEQIHRNNAWNSISKLHTVFHTSCSCYFWCCDVGPHVLQSQILSIHSTKDFESLSCKYLLHFSTHFNFIIIQVTFCLGLLYLAAHLLFMMSRMQSANQLEQNKTIKHPFKGISKVHCY